MVTWVLTPGRGGGRGGWGAPPSAPVYRRDPLDRLADRRGARGEAEPHRSGAGAVVEVAAGGDGHADLLQQGARVCRRVGPPGELRSEVGPVVERAVGRR